MPKRYGGLEIKNLKLFNVVLLAKWRWRIIHEPEAIWFDLLKSRYEDVSMWGVFLKRFGTCNCKKSSLWRRDICSIDAVSVIDSDLLWF